MADEARPGDRFHLTVDGPINHVDEEAGVTISCYLPGYDYGVTPKNLEFVNRTIAAGHAACGALPRKTAAGFKMQSEPGSVSGRVEVGPADVGYLDVDDVIGRVGRNKEKKS